MSAKAFPKASITEAFRKLPLSLTKFAIAAPLRWETCARQSHETVAGTSMTRAIPPGTTKRLADPRHPGAQTQGPRRMVVGKHGDDNVASCSIARRLGELRA